ncbi:MAG: hypothetical protein IKQ94_03040 [Bacteroidales bacterium]|nr:hypothetical protein [Bacteroidales bacterium]
MKKYFKVLGLALLATTMFSMTSCTDDEQVALSEDGITVTFGSYTWSAKYSEGATYLETEGLNKRFFAIYATPNDSIGYIPYVEGGDEAGYLTFPMLYFQTEAQKGNNHGTDVYVQYYEKAENTYAFQDGGNWDFFGWEKGQGDDDNMTIAVTDFNSSNFVISGTVKGTLYEIDNEQAHTGNMKNLNVVFKNITLEDLGEGKK